MQAFDLDPNLYSFLSGSFRLWPYTRLTAKPVPDAAPQQPAAAVAPRRVQKATQASPRPVCAENC